MDALGRYLAMGGYAVFVWPAFVLSAAVLIAVLMQSLKKLKSSEAALADLVDTERRST
jgi:heme exporter protein D